MPSVSDSTYVCVSCLQPGGSVEIELWILDDVKRANRIWDLCYTSDSMSDPAQKISKILARKRAGWRTPPRFLNGMNRKEHNSCQLQSACPSLEGIKSPFFTATLGPIKSRRLRSQVCEKCSNLFKGQVVNREEVRED